jgi:phosphoglycolate phosphatase
MTRKLVIFDCDGTIVDSQHMIFEAMVTAFVQAGLPSPKRIAVLSVVGLSLPLAVRRLLPHAGDATVMHVADLYKGRFHELRRKDDGREPLYPGMREAIEALAARDGYVLGIATGKSRRGVGDLIAREHLDGHFLTVQTADTHPSKPHPSMILTAMAEAGAAAADTVMIGDTTFDMEMAQAAKVAAVGVGWGYHPSAALHEAGALAVVDTAEALREAVLGRLEAKAGTP